jgi:dTDP-4-amino-4,6-dideoxygalactose transaminase
MKIPFQDLLPLHHAQAAQIEAAVARTLSSGWYVLGPEVERFEQAFAEYHEIPHAVGVANGTDAIELALRAAGIGPGDEVVTVAHTAVATVCAIERAGATPVLVDVDEQSFTMDPKAADAAITSRTRAIVPVHLYGHPADMIAISQLAKRRGVLVVEDCAQAHGARIDGRKVGAFGDLAAFSFYPTKNLGCYGDGGAVLTSDAQLAARLRRLRQYGQEQRYHHVERGVNSRLDDLQAAILSVKLKSLDDCNEERRSLAKVYDDRLANLARPAIRSGVEHVFHLYVVRHPQRDAFRAALERRGVGSLIHYPVPVHLQPAYRDLGVPEGALPTTERLAKEICSLPLYPGLTSELAARAAEAADDAAREVLHDVCA